MKERLLAGCAVNPPVARALTTFMDEKSKCGAWRSTCDEYDWMIYEVGTDAIYLHTKAMCVTTFCDEEAAIDYWITCSAWQVMIGNLNTQGNDWHKRLQDD